MYQKYTFFVILESINDESDDQTGRFHKFTYPAFAPEADIVITGGIVLAILWYIVGSIPPAITGISPNTAFLESKFFPRFGTITLPIISEPLLISGKHFSNIVFACFSKLSFISSLHLIFKSNV